jgi:putative flippase GtrA
LETNRKKPGQSYPALLRLAKSAIVQRIIAFAIVGSIGFVIDGGILTLAIEIFKLNPYLGRAISFPIAVTATWYLNRRWTFAANASARKNTEYTRYFIIQVTGAAINLGIYFLLITIVPWFALHPIVPLAIAALVAMIFNFLGAQLYVFTKTVKPEDSGTAK